MEEMKITLSVSEYNKLIDMHTPKDSLPPKVVVKKAFGKFWKFIKGASLSLLHYRKNINQKRLIKFCISEAVGTIYSQVYGYWGSSINEDMKEHFSDFQEQYKRQIYESIMNQLKDSKS